MIAVVAADCPERKILGSPWVQDRVHRIVLVGKHSIEERFGIDKLMDLCQRQVMMGQESGLLVLQTLHDTSTDSAGTDTLSQVSSDH